MNALALFDFDHTITSRDSFTDFILYAVGRKRFFCGFALLSPLVVAYKLGYSENWRAKEIVFSYFFEDWDIERFEKMALQYSHDKLPRIMRKIALERINWHKSRGHKIIIVSASIECWLKGWCQIHQLDLVATKVEVRDNRLTGKLGTINCYGIEKVNRLKEKCNVEEFDYIYAYGDSPGDREMLQLANEKYYRWKRVYD